MRQEGSKRSATAAIRMAMSFDRAEEMQLKEEYQQKYQIRCGAVDFGGEFVSSITRLVERAVVAARREGITKNLHAEEGAVIGATREAISQVMSKALGMNVGGKIGIARYHDHISVALFLEIGFLDLDEVAIGLGHRAVS